MLLFFLQNVFAFHYREDFSDEGWDVYDPEAELERMVKRGRGKRGWGEEGRERVCLFHHSQGVDTEGVVVPWRTCHANKDYSLCETYPAIVSDLPTSW